VYGLHGTVVSIHAVYSTVRTMVGVSLPYRLHVLLQYTPHGTVVSVHPVYSVQVLFVLPSRWCVTLQHHLHVLQYTPHDIIILVPQTSDYSYRIVCIYTLHAATPSFPSQLLSLPLSRSLSFQVNLCIVAPSHSWWICALLSCHSCGLLSCRLWFHHDEFGACLFPYCRCITTVLYARSVRAAW
jgi:hypothetical protein